MTEMEEQPRMTGESSERLTDHEFDVIRHEVSRALRDIDGFVVDDRDADQVHTATWSGTNMALVGAVARDPGETDDG